MTHNTTLIKLLIESGLGSRRKLADAIRQGRVQVNGTIAENFKQTINPAEDSVIIDGQVVNWTRPQMVYLMLNKPAGVITTTSDERERKTVMDLVPHSFRTSRLYPVGRLDKNSTGLLLLTNNGDLAYQLTHPKFEHEKEYLVAIRDKLKPEEERRLEKGLKLVDGRTYPSRVRKVRNMLPFNYIITIHEGRKRQVRRMFEELGHSVLALRRVRMGNLRLGNLKEGEVRELSVDEIKNLLPERR